MKTAIQELIDDELNGDTKSIDYYLEKEKEQINKSFLDGFKYSGEGYNGEYPFEGCTDKSISTSIDLDRYYQETYIDSNQAGI